MLLLPVVGANYFVYLFLCLFCAGIYWFFPSLLLSVIAFCVFNSRPVRVLLRVVVIPPATAPALLPFLSAG